MHYVLTSAAANPGVPNKTNTCGRIISRWLFSVLCWCQWALTGCASNATDQNLLRHPLVCWQPFLQKLFAEPRTGFPKKRDTEKKEKKHTYSVGRQQSTLGLQITLQQSSKLLKKNPTKTAHTKEHCSRHFFKYLCTPTHMWMSFCWIWKVISTPPHRNLMEEDRTSTWISPELLWKHSLCFSSLPHKEAMSAAISQQQQFSPF